MKISIIIPTVGRSTLKPVLESLFRSYKIGQYEVEILVVFDGKKPDRFFVNDTRVKILETDSKQFASGARNLGLEKATGSIVAFLGDDTLVDAHWLSYTIAWHQQYPAAQDALLGRIFWAPALADDPFHIWLESHAQFDFKRLDSGKKPDWRHFYTANISLKKSIIGTLRFSNEFSGWGFEDAEFGYQLEKHGLSIFYEPSIKVYHDDKQNLGRVIDQTKSARQNAFVFETLHPEVKIIPTGIKRVFLKEATVWAKLFQFIPQVRWWRAWKKAWLGL
jgi:GT2 family glycosyltransferase